MKWTATKLCGELENYTRNQWFTWLFKVFENNYLLGGNVQSFGTIKRSIWRNTCNALIVECGIFMAIHHIRAGRKSIKIEIAGNIVAFLCVFRAFIIVSSKLYVCLQNFVWCQVWGYVGGGWRVSGCLQYLPIVFLCFFIARFSSSPVYFPNIVYHHGGELDDWHRMCNLSLLVQLVLHL